MASDDIGKLVLRLTVGVLLLLHGAHKILTGIAPVEDMVTVHHLPDFIAYFVYAGEVLGPLLVILGVLTRLGGAVIAINMLFAVMLARTGSLLVLSPSGGYALELEAFYLFCGLAIVLLGAGRLAIMRPGALN